MVNSNKKKRSGSASSDAALQHPPGYQAGQASRTHEGIAVGEPDRHDVKQRWLAQAALVALLGDVTESSLASDTPASKLRQLGMLVYIIELIGESKPITLTSLVAVSGLSRSVVAETMDRLVERGSLTQSMGKNAWGRGKARQFDVGPAFRRLLEL